MEEEIIECPNCKPDQFFKITWKQGDKTAPIVCKICGVTVDTLDLVAEGMVDEDGAPTTHATDYRRV